MNSNTLRIRGSDTTTRTNTSFDPVTILDSYKTLLSEKNEVFKEFFEDNSEIQLAKLKQILFSLKENFDYNTVKFLVIIYLQADSKHPSKCIISRFVSKNNFIQNEFTEVLTKEVDHLIDQKCTDYNSYVYVISKVTSCTENFPSGAAAVKNLEMKLANYCKDCLHCCISTLSDVKFLSPTEKNEIYSLAHSTLRLILYIVQKISEENKPKLIALYDKIRNSLKYLLCDADVPIDTKSVCGILYVSMHIMENGSDSWIDILLTQHIDNNYKEILYDEAAKLSIYSALVTVIPIEKLKEELPDGEPAIIKITNNILGIGERCSADMSITLGVSRALVAVSRAPGAAPALPGTLLEALGPALDHRADAVRHLAAHALRNLVRHCDGNEEAMEDLFAKLMHLDRERKSFYVSLTSLTSVLGAENIMKKLPNIVSDLISALHIQAVQASATTTLETLLQKHIQTSNSDVIFEQWIKRILIHINDDSIDSAVMNILESLLVLALKLDSGLVEYFLPHIQSSGGRSALVCASALRRVALLPPVCVGGTGGPVWRGTLPYELLRQMAVDCNEENRILCISLIVESPKTTEIFEEGELDLILWFLTYNINAQEPHFRQQVLSLMKKFIKRLENSYKVLLRESKASEEDKGQYYLRFLDRLRYFCFDSLIIGANYSRRHVALQILMWVEEMDMEGYSRSWKDDEIETLLRYLGDSYEVNKALALELLCRCPRDVLQSKKFSTSLDLNDILTEASSIKPTDCVTAVYKLKLLITALPDHIVEGSDSNEPNKVKFALLSILLGELKKQVSVCKQSIVLAARNAPMYGLLHCVGHSVGDVSPIGVPPAAWSAAIHHTVDVCEQVWTCTAAVLSSAAPEGHLPTRGEQGSILLEDGKEVTAQMVLLCAWRSIKEVSLILGNLVTRALIEDGFDPATRSVLVRRVGDLFTTLLTETKHRGAFEQVYVGFTKMLTSLWRSRNPEFNELPKLWLEELMSAIESGDPSGKLCATRRSAGLPFMIQALVITELQVKSNPRGFDECVTRLLRLAAGSAGASSAASAGAGVACGDGSASDVSASEVSARSANSASSAASAGIARGVGSASDVSASADGASSASSASPAAGRCHALNALRALVRDRALHDRIAPHAATALLLALAAFERDSWIERNSATLLFSALMVRIFGVQRTKDSENLCVRNRMTGRIFFLRYPKLYDFMLDKLKEVSENNNERLLRPSLYPILLLLARLYPSSLEGTVSNLKLSAFVPLVRACARSAVLTTRRLAARAISALVEPERYIEHIEEVFELINNRTIKRNYCHGLLLQLIKLLESKPEKLSIDKDQSRLLQLIKQSEWILRQSLGDVPCYLIADEYIKMINVLIWRFGALIEEGFIINIQKTLNQLIFNDSKFKINPGRELCLANAAYLHLIISHKYNHSTNVPEYVYKCLAHKNYEVTCAVLNYLLILNKDLELENNFQHHISEISDGLHLFENDPKYIENLCKTFRSSKYLECTQKCLKLITLADDAARIIIEAKMGENEGITDDLVVDKLLYYINNEHENLMHFYLGSLCKFLLTKMAVGEINEQKFLEALRVIFSCSLPNNSDETRMTVVDFLEKSLSMVPGLLDMKFEKLSEEDRLCARGLPRCAAAAALHDDSRAARAALCRPPALRRPPALHLPVLRCRPAQHPSALHTCAARALLHTIPPDGLQIATLALLALLDFKVEVTSDDLDPECRVFDQNEKYNIYLEETIWTRDCARRIKEVCDEKDICEYIYNTINEKKYGKIFENLCGDNFIMFEKFINGPKNNINPRVKIFIDTLRST